MLLNWNMVRSIAYKRQQRKPFYCLLMGATDIALSGPGTSMYDAYQRLHEQSKQQDGEDAYSGGFNTICHYNDLTDEWRNSGREASEYLEDEERMERLDSREVNAVCLRPPTSQREGEYLFVGWAAE